MTKNEVLKLALEALEVATTPLAKDRQEVLRARAAIREALAQPEQEPVAWSYWQSCLNDDGTQTAPWVHRLSKFKPNESIINKDIVPLYTTPPQRKPLEGVIDVQPIGYHSLQLIFRSQTDIAKFKAAHGIKE